MKEMDWTKFKNKDGVEEEFRIVERDIQFSRDSNFIMGSKDFIVCCVNVEKIPVTSDKARKEIHLGEDHKCEVFVSRTATEDNQEELEQIVQITLKKEKNTSSSIEFTVGELINILQVLAESQGLKAIQEVDNGSDTVDIEKETTLKTSVETLSKMTELLSKLIVNLENI